MKEQLVFNFSAAGLGADSFLPTRTRSAAESKRLYNQKHKERIAAQKRDYYLKNRQKILERNRVWERNNPEKRARISRKTINKNRLKRIEAAKVFNKKKYAESQEFRLRHCLRARIRKTILGKNNSARSLALLGCTLEFLKTWLESKFKPGMTWENHGRFGWHIDHIRPCSSFDLSKPDEQAVCFHYTNLQPLWAYENLSKSDKVITSAKHHAGW